MSYTADTWGITTFSANNQNIQINVTEWKTINLTNGKLYVNESERLCELHYSKRGVSLSANTWKDIETIPQIASYPHKQENDHFYVSGSMPYYVVRIYRNGQVKAYSTEGTSLAVTFSTMWHY